MSKFLHQQPIILASGSPIRLKLLQSLGIDFSVVHSHCDEEAIKANFTSDNIIDLGHLLAASKALDVSIQYPEHFIIAADQLCIMGNKLFNKPLDHATAVEHLSQLCGNEHQQIACVCIAKNGKVLWKYQDIAYLTLHQLSLQTIESYLQNEKPYQSCGAYQYETLGKWLFKTVTGNEDTILGLPLRPVVQALLELGAVSFKDSNHFELNG